MIKFVGRVDLPGAHLKYYVFGNKRCGYSIRIILTGGQFCSQYVSQDLLAVLDLARKLKRCSVFPENLSEIIEDLQYEAVCPKNAGNVPLA